MVAIVIFLTKLSHLKMGNMGAIVWPCQGLRTISPCCFAVIQAMSRIGRHLIRYASYANTHIWQQIVIAWYGMLSKYAIVSSHILSKDEPYISQRSHQTALIPIGINITIDTGFIRHVSIMHEFKVNGWRWLRAERDCRTQPLYKSRGRQLTVWHRQDPSLVSLVESIGDEAAF